MHVMVLLELSCDSPVFLGSGIIVHGSVHGVLGEGVEEPVGEFPFFVDGDVLWGKEFVPVDRLTDAGSAQAVKALELDEWGEDVDHGVTIGDQDEEVKHVSFIFLIPLRSLHLSLPGFIPPVCVGLPVLIGFFQVSSMCLTFCQIFSVLAEYFQLLLVVVANFFMLSSNTGQPLSNVEEFLPSRGTVTFKSSAH